MNIEIRIRSFQIFMLSINSQSSQKLITIGVVDGAPALMSNITGMFSIYKVCQWHGLAPLRITTNKSNFWCFFSAQTYTFIPRFTDFLGKCCFMQRHPLNFTIALCSWTNLSQATVSLSNFQLCYRKWGELWIICHASNFFSQLAVYCYSNENTVIIYQNDFLTWPFVQTEYRWVDPCSSRGNLLAAVWCQTTHLNAFM